MKLTISDRDAFVLAVMNDVPKINYNEQAHKLIKGHAYSIMPAKIKAVFDDKKLIGYLTTPYFYVSKDIDSICLPGTYDYRMDQKTTDAVFKLGTLNKEQKEKYKKLKEQVMGVIKSCNTLKQAMERLPEFAEYLPKDRDGTGVSNLPAISNTVAELVQAGWPKNKPKPTRIAKYKNPTP